MGKALNVLNAHCIYKYLLKVTGEVSTVRGCSIGGAFIYCIAKKMTVQTCFVLLFIASVFFLSLKSILPHCCLMLGFSKSSCHYDLSSICGLNLNMMAKCDR